MVKHTQKSQISCSHLLGWSLGVLLTLPIAACDPPGDSSGASTQDTTESAPATSEGTDSAPGSTNSDPPAGDTSSTTGPTNSDPSAEDTSSATDPTNSDPSAEDTSSTTGPTNSDAPSTDTSSTTGSTDSDSPSADTSSTDSGQGSTGTSDSGSDTSSDTTPGTSCQDGQTQPCGTDVGACQSGTQRCVDGVWGSCDGEIAPVQERCNQAGIDEDCDGTADLADADCECLDDAPPTTCSIEDALGDCALGKVTCANGQLSECTPRFPKSPEACAAIREDELGQATGDEDCDGEVDEANGPEEPLNCQLYMLDIDRDGWGAIGPSYIEAGVQATWGCFCNAPDHDVGLEYFSKAPSRDRVNADCGDCFETDAASVFPGQEQYFEAPSACLTQIGWPGGPFDYNCDGQEEKHFTGVQDGACIELTDGEIGCTWAPDSVGHWLEGADPACGISAVVPGCRLSKLSNAENWFCTKIMKPAYMDTQECR